MLFVERKFVCHVIKGMFDIISELLHCSLFLNRFFFFFAIVIFHKLLQIFNSFQESRSKTAKFVLKSTWLGWNLVRPVSPL